ncbi:recombination mediator RecR [Euzebya sp.]|uniref:recombination mediator RecR n=1 Tax=Euzebya sp. TaxID=1971409 RepID=UPI0035110AB9
MYEGPVQALIDELGRLPGVGPKSAQRLAFHLLGVERTDAERLAGAILAAARDVHFCRRCFNVAAAEECRICRDAKRDEAVLCVVAEPRDVQAIEKTGEFRGRYHVLGGLIVPIDGITPDKLHIAELIRRLGEEPVTEVVIALNPTVDGETTASYLRRQLADLDVSVTRIASGLPVGGDLEYADQITLGRAFAGRTSM